MDTKSCELESKVVSKVDLAKNSIKKISLSELSGMYEVLRKDALESIKISKENKRIVIKAEGTRISNFQYKIIIKDNEMRRNLIDRFSSMKIDFKQKRNVIRTSLSGAVISSGSLSTHLAEQLLVVENEIQSRMKTKVNYKIIARIQSKDGFKWAVSDKSIGNTYQFMSLCEMKKALDEGFVKRKRFMFDLRGWSMPSSLPTQWEKPNSIKNMGFHEKDYGISGLAGASSVAVSGFGNLGLSGLATSGIEAFFLYPLFLSLMEFGYEDTGRNINSGIAGIKLSSSLQKDLRSLLIASLIREEKIKEEISLKINSGVQMTPGSKIFKLIVSLGKESAVRETIAELFKKELKSQSDLILFEDEVKKLISETGKIEKECNTNVSFESLYHLSDKKLYRLLTQNGKVLQEDPQKYGEFIRNLSNWKQNADGSFIKKINTYLTLPLAQTGLGWMLWTTIGFEKAALLEIFKITTGKLPLESVFKAFLSGSTSDIMFSVGQGLMACYGLVRAGEGVANAYSISEWIDRIKKSDIIDNNTKDLVIEYFRDRRKFELINKCLGMPLLTAGQILLIIGGPIGGLGLPFAIPGLGASVMGVGISTASNAIESKRFAIHNNTSDAEKKVLAVEGIPGKDGETVFHANLRWKALKLKELSAKSEKGLAWLIIYGEIIRECELCPVPLDKLEKDEVLELVLNNVSKIFSTGQYMKNMKKIYGELLDDPKTKSIIENAIEMFYGNKVEFYSNISKVVLEPHKEIFEKKPLKEKQLDVPVGAHPDYKMIIGLIDEIKHHNFLSEFKIRLLNNLIVDKKTCENIHASHFRRYISVTATRKYRYFKMPMIIPFVNIKFPFPLSPYKNKTVYTFDDETFKNDLKNYGQLDGKTKKVFDEVLSVMFTERKSVFGSMIKHELKNWIKSDVFRPLWNLIPQLVYQGQIEAEFNAKKNVTKVLPVKDEKAIVKILQKNNLPKHFNEYCLGK